MTDLTRTAEPSDPYVVEIDDGAMCRHCGHGRMWLVVGPGDVAEGISFADETDAHEYAGALNSAFNKGVRAQSDI